MAAIAYQWLPPGVIAVAFALFFILVLPRQPRFVAAYCRGRACRRCCVCRHQDCLGGSRVLIPPASALHGDARTCRGEGNAEVPIVEESRSDRLETEPKAPGPLGAFGISTRGRRADDCRAVPPPWTSPLVGCPFLLYDSGFESGSDDVRRLVKPEDPETADELRLSYEPATGEHDLSDWASITEGPVDWTRAPTRVRARGRSYHAVWRTSEGPLPTSPVRPALPHLRPDLPPIARCV